MSIQPYLYVILLKIYQSLSFQPNRRPTARCSSLFFFSPFFVFFLFYFVIECELCYNYFVFEHTIYTIILLRMEQKNKTCIEKQRNRTYITGTKELAPDNSHYIFSFCRLPCAVHFFSVLLSLCVEISIHYHLYVRLFYV